MKELSEFSCLCRQKLFFFPPGWSPQTFLQISSFFQQLPSPGEKSLPLFNYYNTHLFMLSLLCIFTLLHWFCSPILFFKHTPLGYYVQKPLPWSVSIFFWLPLSSVLVLVLGLTVAYVLGLNSTTKKKKSHLISDLYIILSTAFIRHYFNLAVVLSYLDMFWGLVTLVKDPIPLQVLSLLKMCALFSRSSRMCHMMIISTCFLGMPTLLCMFSCILTVLLILHDCRVRGQHLHST